MLAAFAFAALAASAVAAAPSEELRHDDRGRPVIGAYVDGRGPFDMVVDTAAQASLIVEPLARELRLASAAETMNVSGATGAAEARVYPVRRFHSALFDLRDGALVALPNAGSTSARGIVGMDLLAARKLVFDRANRRLVAEPSAPPAPGYVALRGRTDGGTMLSVPVVLNGVTVQALVDTGAAVTIVNAAALAAMGWADDDPRLRAGGEIRGATAAAARVRTATVERVAIGPATLRDVPLVVSEHASDGAAGAPAMILGSDLLNLFEAFAVDLTRGELQVRIPGPPSARRP